MSAKLTQTEIDAALTKLSPKDGDIIFVNAYVIDPEAFVADASPNNPDVLVVAVYPKPGQSVADAVHKLTRAELQSLVGEVQ